METGAPGDPVTIRTSHEEIEVDRSDIIHFPEGLIGFEEYTDFVIRDIKGCAPFKSMLSIREGGPDFVVIEPVLVFEDYFPFVADVTAGGPEPGDPKDDLMLLSIVTLSDRPEDITVNLRGPVILNLRTRRAKQVIIPDDRFRTKVPLLVNG